MLFDNKSANDFSSVPLLLCSDMRRGVNVDRNDTKLNKQYTIVCYMNIQNICNSIQNTKP